MSYPQAEGNTKAYDCCISGVEKGDLCMTVAHSGETTNTSSCTGQAKCPEKYVAEKPNCP